MLLFLDTETTGKDNDARLVQLCIKQLKEDAITFTVRPPIPISFEAMATHHITQKIVAGYPSLKEAHVWREMIQRYIDENIIVAHNAPFDVGVLRNEGFKIDDNKIIDTLKVARILWDEPMYKLQYLRYRFGIEIEATAHDAEGDVLVLERLYDYMFKVSFDLIGEMTSERFAEWAVGVSSKPSLLRRIGFGKHSGKTFEQINNENPDYLQWLNKQTDIDEDLKFTLNHWLKLDGNTATLL